MKVKVFKFYTNGWTKNNLSDDGMTQRMNEWLKEKDGIDVLDIQMHSSGDEAQILYVLVQYDEVENAIIPDEAI